MRKVARRITFATLAVLMPALVIGVEVRFVPITEGVFYAHVGDTGAALDGVPTWLM